MARRRFFRRTRSARRKLVWVHSLDTDLATTTSGFFDCLTDFRTIMGVTANLPGATIARIRATVQLIYDPAVAATSISGTMFGFIVGTIGTAPPGPVASPNQDWMYRKWFSDALPFQTIDPAAGAAMSSFEIDVKSMRKLEEVQQTLMFSWVRTGVPNLDELTLSSSTLLMLP